MRDLRAGKTWVATVSVGILVATLTADHEDSPVWPKESKGKDRPSQFPAGGEPGTRGRGPGGSLPELGPACGPGIAINAQWVRVDVWTTNKALHAYYQDRGFEFYGLSEEVNDDYPSAALFQKPTELISPPGHALFRLAPRGSR